MSDQKSDIGSGADNDSDNGRTNAKRYIRGVRASRVALSRALLDSGLRTQVALAQLIAELEGLESPPKDSVSRAFREKAVDPGTIARIARALNVEPHLLYLSAEQAGTALSDARFDVSPTPLARIAPSVSSLVPKPARRLPTAREVVGVALVITIAAIWISLGGTNYPSLAGAIDLTNAPGGVLTVVLAPDEANDDTQALLQVLSRHVTQDVRVSLPGPAIAGGDADPEVLRETLRAHLAVSRTESRHGRYLAIGLHWSAEKGSGVLAAVAGLRVEREQLLNSLGKKAGIALSGIAAGDFSHYSAPPSLETLGHYLHGREALDRATSDDSFRQAGGRFRSALEDSPDWAPAHAGLCESMLFNSWVDNEQQALQAAREQCAQALALDAQDAYVRSVWGHYLRRTGQAKAGVDFLTQLSASDASLTPVQATMDLPRIDPLGQLAESDFALYRETGDSEFLRRATGRLQRLTSLESDYWRWYSLLATYYFYAQELELSVSAGKQALALQPQPLVLVNLGMAQFCLGDLGDMLDSFESVTVLEPSGYFGYEYSGLAQFYLGNYGESVRLRQLALDQIGHSGEPEIHQMWGGLADALRHADQKAAAISAYQSAAEILERDFLSGTAAASDEAHRSYYAAIVEVLRGGEVEVTVESLEQLGSIELDQSSRVRLAQLATFLGETEFALGQADQAFLQCAGLSKHPDLIDLRESGAI